MSEDVAARAGEWCGGVVVTARACCAHFVARAVLLTLAGVLVVGVTAAGARSPSAPGDPTGAAGPAADRILRARNEPMLGDPATALRAARAAIDDRDRSHAIWMLDQVVQRHPIIADHAALLQIRLLQEEGDAKAAAAAARKALQAAGSTPLRPEIHALLGEALNDRGDWDGAYAAWRAALDESQDAALRAHLLLSIATAQERQGLDDEAATTYKLIWYAYPVEPEARIAGHRLDLLEEYLDREIRKPSDWRRRGDRLFRKRHNEAALEAYDIALERGLSRGESERARRQRAHTLFRQRRYPEALEAFTKLPQRDDVPIWRARAMARAGEVMSAIAEFERIAKKKRGIVSVRARFLAGLLLDGRGYEARAQAHFRAVAESAASAGMSDAANWRLGWAAYRAGRHAEAIGHFDRQLGTQPADSLDSLRPRYWRARCLEHLGDPAGAEAFAQLALEYPFSYYGWRARDRAADSSAPPPRIDPPSDRRRLAPQAMARPRILLEAGFDEAVRDEIKGLTRGVRGVSERLELAKLSTDAGDYHLAQRLVVDPYQETLARGPLRNYEELWWYAWPSAYSRLVGAATSRPDSVEPELVYSIMREESGYRAEVISPVGARGLLQIMTTTGERLARTTGLAAFQSDDLFEPRINIDLGSHYLAELSRRFEGRLSASIASYNAGPDAVKDWALQPVADDDEWVESIPYDQTRSYVKRVLRSLYAYRVLY